MKFSADELAALTAADPHHVLPPSPEQRLIIEADPQTSMKVTAGAGSGKTTVISQRVVWLVANGHVCAEEILGLTFTRKAVGELGSRIRVLLARLERQLGSSSDLTLPGLDSPTVSTYNSYAASIVGEYGVNIGIEPETMLLDDAGAYAIAGAIIDAASIDDVPPEVARDTMIADMISLAGAMNDHGRDVEEVTRYLQLCLDALISSRGKEIDAPRRRKLEAKIRTARLAGKYMEAKRANLAMDFSDQVRFAQRILDEVPAALSTEQARWKIVLLDEFQDTSVAQLTLLRTLFSRAAVTAVGDPRQAIYGWRGASADNMIRFSQDFRNVESLSLSTSWRNDESILNVANTIADRLPGEKDAPLRPRPGAGVGAVVVDVSSGAHDPDYGTNGLRSLVEWAKSLPEKSTKAVLCRKRAQFGTVATALEAAGFAVHIHGSSGLLTDPFVADLRAVLTVAVDPLAGDHFMRLASGRVLGLGAHDIAALAAFTRAQNDDRLDYFTRENDTDQPVVLESIDQSTIVEGVDELVAIDDLTSAPKRKLPESLKRSMANLDNSGLSRTAIDRLVRLGRSLRTIRSASGSVTAIIRRTIEAIGFDVDIWALPDSLRNLHRSAFDSFLSAANQYGSSVDRPTLNGFLEWLSIMESKDALSVAEPNADSRAINIMTVHASKGLEFDAVAIPGLVVRDFPTLPRDKEGWMDRMALPYPLRGDAAHLVDFDLSTVEFETAKELNAWIADFIRPGIEHAHAGEERRLAYVAFTRAKHHLFLGAELMNGRSAPDELSPFITEAIGVLGIDPEIPLPAETDQTHVDETAMWPVSRDATVATARLAAEWVERAETRSLDELSQRPSPVGDFARRALAIRSRRQTPGIAEMPERLSATSLVAWRRNPSDYRCQTLRPVPEAPSRAAEIGTTFHAWVEQHFGQSSIDIDDDRSIRPADVATLERLQGTFLDSEFAHRHADHVELSFELVLGRFRVPGKIDAVFIDGQHAEVVDWKTSKRPDDAVLEVMKWQLALYRFAVQRTYPHIAEVTGTFYFLGSNEVVRFTELPDEAEIIAWLESHEGSSVNGQDE